MSRTTTIALSGLGCLAIAGGVWYSLTHRPASASPTSPAVAKAREERRSVDQLYASKPAEAEKGYSEFVSANRDSKVPEVQDEVGSARIRLGYLAAKKKDFGKARLAFQEAEKNYQGTGAMGADFGGIKDQAAYQAAVCLSAMGKKDEARSAYLAFMKDYKLSPLVQAVHRRLEDLNGGEPKPEYDALLQQAIAAQEERIRFETSVCGPKALAYVLKELGKPERDYKELAKLCGTTDDGTTIEGMKRGLKACGLQAIGYEVNRDDFLRLKSLTIVLSERHYMVLRSMTATDAILYDPMLGGEKKIPLPKPDQTDFSVPVLCLEPLEPR